INLEFSYSHVFASSPSPLPVTPRSIAFERASILFNVAALYSQFKSFQGQIQLRCHKACKRLGKGSYLMLHLKNAAGIFVFLSTSALLKLGPLADSDNTPPDLS
ncbi:hypothetical protein EDB19DRAFT_1577787, partial [Suillus lakei]